ncbi:MAG: CoA protein activase [Firmicutes bacterium]|jgi:predicted nucleotide-binding protein (sugar kinase/HSP70/actin superfamily)|nr:CoA protein activase [Bacillota bacterium]
MRITFPHLGNLWIPVKAFLSSLGHEVITPPPTTKRTLSIGARHTPDGACLPLKVTMGNFFEAAELGADTILMVGGIGPCRLGYYCELQRRALARAGCSARLIVVEPPLSDPRGFASVVRTIRRRATFRQILEASRLAWAKFQAVDALDQAANMARWREIGPGSVDECIGRGLALLDAAETCRAVREVAEQTLHDVEGCIGAGPRWAARVGVVGEIYIVMEPAVNMDVCRKLGRLGAQVVQPLTFSHWIESHVVCDIARWIPKPDVLSWSRPYLRHFVGGHGVESVGHSVDMARSGLHGVVHLAPMTCMPEIVAGSILPSVSLAEGIPAMSLAVDEHTADTGFDTRLEAFVDLLLDRSREEGNTSQHAGSARIST